MNFISDIDFKKKLAKLLIELKSTTNEKEKQRLEEEINSLKKMRYESSVYEKLNVMEERRR